MQFAKGASSAVIKGQIKGDTTVDYVVRVYLMRPAARRGESSNYTLTIGVTGKPLVPIAASKDAVMPGTSYHASAKIKCVPAFETAPRKGDVTIVKLGTSERYEIPDVLVTVG